MVAALLALAPLLLSRGVGGSSSDGAQQGSNPEPTLREADGAHSAVFVLTQDGLNNAPELYSQFLADAIAAANQQVRPEAPHVPTWFQGH